jgi:hypothetical protein
LQATMFNRDAARGAYKVTKQLPESDGEFEYQVKRPGEPHERVVKESAKGFRPCLPLASAAIQRAATSTQFMLETRGRQV